MKKYSLIFCFLLGAMTTFAQPVMDSLLAVLAKTPQISVVRCAVLRELTDHATDTKTVLFYVNQIRDIAEAKLKSNLSDAEHKAYESELAFVYMQYGNCSNYNDDYIKASEHLFKSLKIAEKYDLKDVMAHDYINIGSIFFQQKEFDKALIYYKKCYTTANAAKSYEVAGNSLSNTANLFSEIDQMDSALYYNQKALALRRKTGHEQGIAASLSNIGTYYYRKTKEYDKALTYFFEAIAIDEKNKALEGLPPTYGLVAQVYQKQGKLKEAEVYARKSYDLSKKLNYPMFIFKTSKTLMSIYKEMGRYKDAYAVYEVHNAMKDTMYTKESRNIGLKAEFQHEADKKQAEIKALAQENRIKTLQTWALIGGLVLLALLAYTGFSRYKIRKTAEMLQQENKAKVAQRHIELEKIESELTALKSQMNPHFIFNALNSIQELYLLGDKRIANEQMGNFATLTREILNMSNLKTVPLQREMMLLDKYLQLEKVRFDDNFEYNITLKPEYLDTSRLAFPPMLIQPYIENAIKHGLLHQKGMKKLNLTFEVENTDSPYLLVTIIDNGVGRARAAEINKNRPDSHQSFATSATQKRLELLNNGRKMPIQVEYTDLPQGTKVVVRIPVEVLA